VERGRRDRESTVSVPIFAEFGSETMKKEKVTEKNFGRYTSCFLSRKFFLASIDDGLHELIR